MKRPCYSISTLAAVMTHILLATPNEVAAFHNVNTRSLQQRTTRLSTMPVTASSALKTQSSMPEIFRKNHLRNLQIRVNPALRKNPLRELPAWLKSHKRSMTFVGALFVSMRFLPLLVRIASPWQILQHSVQKFLLDWKTFCLIPFVAAFVGWITNYLAVQMIFFPIQWRGIPLIRMEGNPLGLLGWQGIIPAKTAKMSEAMVNVTINELLSMEETIKRLDPDHVADMLAPEIPGMMKSVLDDDETSSSLSPKLRSAAKELIDHNDVVGKRVLQNWFGKTFLKKLTIDVQHDIANIFNVRNCVVNQMMSDRSLLGQLFQKTGGKELKFLTDSGLWFGFLLGIFQMLVALICENPWTLSIGGLIVGLATNWIALKWIFEPIEPTKFGPFTLQGKFLRRQKEVAKDFSQFFATNILNSNEMWKSILYDASTSPNFRALFSNNLIEETKRATKGLIGSSSEHATFLQAAGTKVTQNLPRHFEQVSFHAYVDKKLGIEKTLRSGLESMSSKNFEQILHPIFQEDELTLILAGGFLGFVAGFAQQLFATGAWAFPSLAVLSALVKQFVPFL